MAGTLWGADVAQLRNTGAQEKASGQTLCVKDERDGMWIIGTSNTQQKDITERTGVDDAALLDHIRTIRQD